MNYPWQTLALACLTGLGLTVVSMPAYLRWAKQHGWGQCIREEGPQDHLSKAGTPTMGGLVLLTCGLLAGFWQGCGSWDALVARIVIVCCGLLGVTDDLSKVLKKQNLGLKARHKLAAQGLIGTVLAVWLICTRPEAGVHFPVIGFVGGAWLLWLITVLVTAGATNAVNLTDGLDGLAAKTAAAALTAFAVICCAQGAPDLGAIAMGLAGACLGFLWFNAYPARVFMGDTGSLALGGALAVLSLLTQSEFLLVIIGGVFVMEAVSVMIQVTYFKLTHGKRVFRMTPIHHHFELGGLHEVQVTARFSLMGVFLAVLGCLIYFGVI